VKSDDLDRVLSESREIRPSGSFASTVMVAVRREAGAPAPLAFPWTRTAVGLASCAVLTTAGVVAVLAGAPVRWVTPEWVGRALVAASSTEMLWLAASLVTSLVSFRWSMRLVGHRS
jgi:hypothetical protein